MKIDHLRAFEKRMTQKFKKQIEQNLSQKLQNKMKGKMKAGTKSQNLLKKDFSSPKNKAYTALSFTGAANNMKSLNNIS